MKESVRDRYLTLKPLIDAQPKNERGALYIGYYPIGMDELIELEHGLKQKLTPELEAKYGEKMAAKIDEMRRELLAFKLNDRKVDLERLIDLMDLGNGLEKLGYRVGLEDVTSPMLPSLPTSEDFKRLGLTEAPTEGSYLVILFEIEA